MNIATKANDHIHVVKNTLYLVTTKPPQKNTFVDDIGSVAVAVASMLMIVVAAMFVVGCVMLLIARQSKSLEEADRTRIEADCEKLHKTAQHMLDLQLAALVVMIILIPFGSKPDTRSVSQINEQTVTSYYHVPKDMRSDTTLKRMYAGDYVGHVEYFNRLTRPNGKTGQAQIRLVTAKNVMMGYIRTGNKWTLMKPDTTGDTRYPITNGDPAFKPVVPDSKPLAS